MINIIVIATTVGALNALRGSGYLKDRNRWLSGLQWALKRIIVPGLIAGAVGYMGGTWVMALVSVIPYYAKIFTGTGGDMQAQYNNVCYSVDACEEFEPFDWVADKYASITDWGNYCQRWGFTYCLQWGVVYSLPFLATNYLYGLPCLLYPVLARYAKWRVVEFTHLAVYVALFLGSI